MSDKNYGNFAIVTKLHCSLNSSHSLLNLLNFTFNFDTKSQILTCKTTPYFWHKFLSIKRGSYTRDFTVSLVCTHVRSFSGRLTRAFCAHLHRLGPRTGRSNRRGWRRLSRSDRASRDGSGGRSSLLRRTPPKFSVRHCPEAAGAEHWCWRIVGKTRR